MYACSLNEQFREVLYWSGKYCSSIIATDYCVLIKTTDQTNGKGIVCIPIL